MKVNKTRVYKFRFTKSDLTFSLNHGLCVLLAMLVWILNPIQVFAQQVNFKIGSRVKVDAPSMRADDFIGEIVSWSDSSMVLKVGEYTYIVPFTKVREMSVSTGITRHVKQGVKFGAIAGIAVGGFIGFFTYEPCIEDRTYSCFGRAKSRTGATILGGILGLVPGALFGRLLGSYESENWVKLPQNIQLNMEPVGTLQPKMNTQLTLKWTFGSKR